MRFALSKGPFLRSKRSTTGIMLELFAVLAVVWLVSVVTYTVRYNFTIGLRAILVVLVSLVTTLLIDVVMALIKGKRKVKEIGHFVLTSYSYVTAIIFALCLPVTTGYYIVVLGAIVSTLLGKYLFGGFGYNVFNPAIIGRIFVGLAFGDKLFYGITGSNVADSASYDFVTGATVTGSVDWASGIVPAGYDWKTILFGNYTGALGETFTILLVVAAIYLIIRGIINFRLIGGYLITIAGISLFLGLMYHPGNALSYVLLQLATGGVMFGAVFMITDPVTSPKSMNGKILYAIGAGCLTMLIRVNSSYPEGVMFSIALMNMLNPLIDSCIKGNTFTKVGARWAIIGGFLVGAIGLNVGFNALYPLEKNDLVEMFGKTSNITNISNTLEEEEYNAGIQSVYKVKKGKETSYAYVASVKDSFDQATISFILVIDNSGKISKVEFTEAPTDLWGNILTQSFEKNVIGQDKVSDYADKTAGATFSSRTVISTVKVALEHFGGVR